MHASVLGMDALFPGWHVRLYLLMADAWSDTNLCFRILTKHLTCYFTLPGMQMFFGSDDPGLRLPLNGRGGPIPFENDLFKGVVEVHVKGIKTTQKDRFEGKKRLFHIVSQVCGYVQSQAQLMTCV